MYLPFQSVHGPLQVPKKYSDMYKHIKNRPRRIFSGMVTAMDDAVGEIVKALEETDMMDNTVIVFSADNGGQTIRGGNNYPLRGNKATLWEGGTRAASFFKHPNMKEQGWISSKLMHVTDWVPTLLSAIAPSLDVNGRKRLNQMKLHKLDGVNQWPGLESQEGPELRHEMLYNIDPWFKDMNNHMNWDRSSSHAALRIGHMKLLLGNPGSPDGWIPPDQVTNFLEEGITPYGCRADIASVDGQDDVRLFNISVDPFEKTNLARDHPALVADMMKSLEKYMSTMIPVHDTHEILAGNPNFNGQNGNWGPGWCDPTIQHRAPAIHGEVDFSVI